MTGGPGGTEAPGLSREEAEAAAGKLAPQLPAALAPLFDASFIYSSCLYDEFIHRLAVGVFRNAGLEAAAREAGRAEELAARAGLATGPAAVPLDWLLRQLAARQVLEAEGGEGRSRFRLRAPLPVLDPAPIREAQRRHDPSWLPSYVLAETVADDYPAFLRGEVAGEDVLFSPARFRLWLEYFSNDNGLYAVNNRVGAIAVDEWLPRDGAAILELGGGLGSAAEALLGRLADGGRLAAVGTYRFTELVPAFLRRGQRVLETRFPGASFLTYGCLDMNRPFAEHGIAPGSVSVVYAVNTLHVAHDLGFTLGEVFGALEAGGRLIVSECVRPLPGHPIYVEFVFNLMEAFRSPRLHPEYRPNGGFLTPEQWRQAMEAAGFDEIRFLPDIPRLRAQFPIFYVAAIGARRPA
ncbi:MAG TPA: class I SAM-dependent methyltransferase [Methylomirabilota bacterium]|jgi:SAM-dependent methyltransferase|nr:class I SAM-dependent methyltransferase [Methylomirabilota bacterium]